MDGEKKKNHKIDKRHKPSKYPKYTLRNQNTLRTDRHQRINNLYMTCVPLFYSYCESLNCHALVIQSTNVYKHFLYPCPVLGTEDTAGNNLVELSF